MYFQNRNVTFFAVTLNHIFVDFLSKKADNIIIFKLWFLLLTLKFSAYVNWYYFLAGCCFLFVCRRLLLGCVQGQSSSGYQDCLLGYIDAFSHGGGSLVFGFIPYFALSFGGWRSCTDNDLRRLLLIKTSALES